MIGLPHSRLHRQLAASHPSIQRGQVWCIRCRNTLRVDPARCLAEGWPRCCGATMTIDSPEERKAHERSKAR